MADDSVRGSRSRPRLLPNAGLAKTVVATARGRYQAVPIEIRDVLGDQARH